MASSFSRRLRTVPPAAVLGVGLALTSVTAYYAFSSARARESARFQGLVDRTYGNLERRIETYIALLRATRGFMATHPDATRQEFQVFIDRMELVKRYPGIQGIGFTRRIPADRKTAVEALLRRQAQPDFRIWPETPREEYHAIVHLEPLDIRNQAAIGYDMFTEPTRRAAMERARDTNLPAASGKVTLVQEIDEDKQAGFLIYLPIYAAHPLPVTVEERRRTLLGFAYSPFRARDLLARLPGMGAEPMALEVYDGADIREEALLHADPKPSEPSLFQATRRLDVAGRPWTLSFRTLPGFEKDWARTMGSVVLIVGTAISLMLFLTLRAERSARLLLERSAEELTRRREEVEALNRLGLAIGGTLDLEQAVQAVTDAGRELTGAAFGGFFYNVKNDRGESYTLYTLSGAPREAFSKFPMPRNTPLFGPTFRGEGTVRIPDVLTDPRYGKNPPHAGMPPGHLAVRSYLAAPVKSRTGEVLGGLFYGHPDPDRFTAAHERLIQGVAAQAGVTIDNAHLYAEARREIVRRTQVEQDIRSLNAGLEARVEARTAELRDVIRELEAFTYTVAHDLRAPLRAIHRFSDLLAEDHPVPDEGKDYLNRIMSAARRMDSLITDLLDYSRMSRAVMNVESVSLAEVWAEVRSQLAQEIADKNARFDIAPDLPRVRGDRTLLHQAFFNLGSNALKFLDERRPPQITVGADAAGDRVRIWVQDNGIGIRPEHRDRLFRIFERLHPDRFPGTGIGLAIVKKAAERMGGRVGVDSLPEGGSRFWIELEKDGPPS